MSIEHNTDAEVGAVCRAVVKGWAAADGGPVSLKITPLSSESSNLLWRVDANPTTWCSEAAGGRVCSVLVRRYNDGTTLLIDRERETAVLQALSQHNSILKASSPILGSFANGRIEVWLEGWEALSLDQMRDPSVSEAVARLVARLHAVVPKGVKDISAKEPVLWRELAAWFKMVGAVSFDDDKEMSAALGQVRLKGLHDEVLKLQKNWEYFAAVSSEPSQIVFSHNGLQLNKIMMKTEMKESDPDRPQVTAVDFEYSDYNMRAFDIANYFNAWAGPDCNWDALPSEEGQKAFIRAYLGKGGWPAEAEALHKEVQLLQLASNVYWAAWAIIQARHGTSGEMSAVTLLRYAEKQVARFYADKDRVYVMVGAQESAGRGRSDGKANAMGDTKGSGKKDAKNGVAGKVDHGFGHDL